MAWTTWCAYAAWSARERSSPRRPWLVRLVWLVWLVPACTAFVVLATGEHYVLDIAAGVALVALVAIVVWLTSLIGDRPYSWLREVGREKSGR